MAYCTTCGSPLNDSQQFCTNCGTKIKEAPPQETPSAVVQNVAPDSPAPRAAAIASQPQQNATLSTVPPIPPAQTGSKPWPLLLIPVFVIIIAIIGFSAASCSKLLPLGSSEGDIEDATFYNSETDNKQEKPSSESQEQPDEENDSQGDVQEETADDAIAEKRAAEAFAKEQEIYLRLTDYYDALAGYDERIAEAAVAFNGNYLSDDRYLRERYAEEANELYYEISAMYDELLGLYVPSTSINVDSRANIETCYNDCSNRIWVICEAWSNSLYYEPPSLYQDEILEPITRDNENGNNKYLTEFNETYPLSCPVEPQAN